MKTAAIVAMVIGALFLALITADRFLFGGAPQRQHAVIRFAEKADEARLARLIADCRAIANGRSLIPKPYVRDCYACMWDDESGYPEEFRDFRPLAAFVGPDSVRLVTSKVYDSSVEIEVGGLRGASPHITLFYGDTGRWKTKVLWPKKSNKAPEPTTLLVTPRAEPRVAPSRVVAHL